MSATLPENDQLADHLLEDHDHVGFHEADAELPSAPLRTKPTITQRFGPFVRRAELWVLLVFGIVVLWSFGVFKTHGPDSTNVTTLAPTDMASAQPSINPDGVPLGQNVTSSTAATANNVPLAGQFSRKAQSSPAPQPSTDPNSLSSQEQQAALNTAAADSVNNSASALSSNNDAPSTMVIPASAPSSQSVPNPSEYQTHNAAIPQVGGAQTPQTVPQQNVADQSNPQDQILVSGGVQSQSPADQQAAPPPASQPITANQASNSEKVAFAAQGGGSAYLNAVEQDAVAQVEVFAGTPLQCHLDDTIVSTLPGKVYGHLTQDVRSSLNVAPAGQPPFYPVIFPKGSELVGRYDNNVEAGQDRIEVAWDYILMPNGRTYPLSGMGAAENDGSTGMRADVNDHRGRTYTTVFLATVLDAATQLANNPVTGGVMLSPSQILAGAASQRISDLAAKKIDAQSQIPPTLTVKPHDFIIRMQAIGVVEPYYQRDIDRMSRMSGNSQ